MKSGRDVRKGCSMSLIIFNLHNEYLTKEALEGSGVLKIGQRLQAIEETVLKGWALE